MDEPEVSGNPSIEEAMADLEAASNEPLHPDLVPWVEESDTWGTMLRHPLVYSIPLVLPGYANKQYLAKKQAVREAAESEDWHRYVFTHERAYRLNALLDITGRDDYDDPLPLTVEHADLAADVWVDSENIEQNVEQWRALLGQPGEMPDFWLGSEVERAAFEALPTIPGVNGPLVKAWRGGSVGDWSWTTDRKIAEFFSRRSGCHIRSHLIPVSDVFGYLTRRSESELLVRFTEFRARLVYPEAVAQ